MTHSQYTPMIQQYLTIKAEYQDAFLFFRLGDFYELFFEDAILASKELEITLTGRAGGTNDRIPMCGVPYHSSDHYIKKLIERGYKVAVCEQTEDARHAQGVVKREVLRVITPGTIMDPSMLPDKDNNFILFLAKAHNQFALVACDLSTGEVVGTELTDMVFLLDEIPQFHAAEIIVDEQSFTQVELETIKFHLKDRIRLIKHESFSSKNWQDHISLLHSDQVKNSEPIRVALQLMLYYVDETQKRSIDHLKDFQYYQASTFLKLDSFSRRNLEITQSIREGSKKGSLLWLLDETGTAMGGRLIKKWIQRPLMNHAQIEERLQAVSTMLLNSFEREELRQLLDDVYDLERLAARVSYGNVNPRDLAQLRKSLNVIPAIKQQLSQFPFSYIQQQFMSLDSCEELNSLLKASIVDDPPISLKEGGIFKQGYHEEVDRLQEASRNGKRWILELEAKERELTGVKTLKVGFNKVFGYYIEVTRSNTHLLKDSRYERKQTLANAERYITPELKEMEALVLDASDKLIDLEHQLYLEFRDEVNQYTRKLQQVADQVAELDVLCSFARVSEKYHYVKPTFSTERQLSITQGRHPVVEKVLKNTRFVANDLMMDSDQRQILLITGPNMAGKSTYMRQVALISIMAQIGCYVPADEAILPIFDQIFTRIGAADDLVGGQSTFMVEMMETKQAITQATSNSLILLDEIGRGTSTYDGMSLAQAVVEYIHDKVQAKTLFSTHYHELTELDQILDKLTNVHVACSETNGRVIFLHTVKEGKADQSYGIHVAQLAELPNEVIERAKEILLRLEGDQNHQKKVKDVANHVQEQRESSDFSYSGIVQGKSSKETTQQQGKPDLQEIRQLSLFDEGVKEVYVKEIEELNLVTMTPLEALNFLFKLQQKVKSNQ
jgi:DNA mismatch repair protein MutS